MLCVALPRRLSSICMCIHKLFPLYAINFNATAGGITLKRNATDIELVRLVRMKEK